MITDDDILLMEEAMILAQQGEGGVNPNPLVGALIVRGVSVPRETGELERGKIIASGYHKLHGDLHAERNAFKDADERGVDVTGATMYVTLEPCCHHGHQPPCTDAILEHKIKRVVVGLLDPNPVVAGKGLEILRHAGVEVEEMEKCPMAERMVKQLKMQNRVFLKYITTGMPWVTAKWAMTLDGKICTVTGDSKWITDEKARERVHMVRRLNMAILCGIGTVLADDPMLNVRLSQEALAKLGISDNEVRQPIRIVADRQARIPLECHLVHTAHEIPTVVAYADGADEEKLEMLQEAGVILWNCNTMTELLQRAGSEKIDSVMLESGGTLTESLVREGLVDEVMAFIAPKIIGGKTALTPVAGEGIEVMDDAIELTDTIVETIGKDVLLSGIVSKRKKNS